MTFTGPVHRYSKQKEIPIVIVGLPFDTVYEDKSNEKRRKKRLEHNRALLKNLTIENNFYFLDLSEAFLTSDVK